MAVGAGDRDAGRTALGAADPEPALEESAAIGEPALERGAVDVEVEGDVVVGEADLEEVVDVGEIDLGARPAAALALAAFGGERAVAVATQGCACSQSTAKCRTMPKQHQLANMKARPIIAGAPRARSN